MRKSIVVHCSLGHCQLVAPVTTNEWSCRDFPYRHLVQWSAAPSHLSSFRRDILVLRSPVAASADAFDRNCWNLESDGSVAADSDHMPGPVLIAMHFASYWPLESGHTAMVDALRRDVDAGGIVAFDYCCSLTAGAVAAEPTIAFDYFLSNIIDLVATYFVDINLAIDGALD